MEASCERDFSYSEPALASFNPAACIKGGLTIDAAASPASTAVPNSPTSPALNSTSKSLRFAAAVTNRSHLDGLRHDLEAAHHKLAAYMENDLGSDRALPAKLVGHIKRLEADVRALQREADQWQDNCHKTQRECAIVADSFEEKAENELRNARHREQLLSARCAELQQDRAEAQDSAARLETEARRQRNDLERERQASRNAGDRAVFLEAHIADLEGRLAAEAASHATMLRELRNEHALATSAAEDRARHLEARIETLLEGSEAFTAKHADTIQRERAQHAEALQAAEKRADQFLSQSVRLEQVVAASASRAERLQRECGDHKEVALAAEKRASQHAAAKEALEESLATVTRRYEALQREGAGSTEAQRAAELRAGQLLGQKARLEEDLAKSTSRVETLQRQVDALQHDRAGQLEARRSTEQRAEQLLRAEDALAVATRRADLLQRETATQAEAARAAESRVGQLLVQKARLEDDLTALTKRLEALQRQGTDHADAVQAAEQRADKFACQNARLEEALAEALNKSRRAEDILQDQSQQAAKLRDAERHVALLEERVAFLDKELSAATTKLREVMQEADVFRTKSDHLEEVNKLLRNDFQAAGSLTPRPPTRPPLTRPGSAPRPLGTQELELLPRSRSIRQRVAANRLQRAELAAGGLPRVRRPSLDGTLLPDRTAALGRYNESGKLVSYDALGRVV